MVNHNESKKHILLKDFAEEKLIEAFDVSKQFIHREFALGDVRYDVAAYPPADAKHLTSIGVECGRKKSTWKKNEEHFEKCLTYMDVVLWLPYSVYETPYFDLMLELTENISTPLVEFYICNEKYSNLANMVIEEDIVVGLLITRKDRYPEFDGWQYRAARGLQTDSQ